LSWEDSDEDDEQSDFGLDEPEHEDTSEESEDLQRDDEEEDVKVAASKKLYCPNCDEEVGSDASYCDNCMTEFERDDA